MIVSPAINTAVIDALKHKDISALNAVYDMYSPAIFGEIKRTLLNEDISEETLQVVFKEIWNNIDLYNPSVEPFFRWAIRLAKREISKQKISLTIKDVFGQHP